jgi:hypothetical protein
MKDERRERLKDGLRQLKLDELLRLRNAKASELCLDTYNFDEQTKTC